MKERKIFIFLLIISIQFLFNIQIIKSFGIRDADAHLLINYIEEKKKTESETLSEDKYMKELMYKNIYSTFNIGIPSQNVKFYYEMNSYESYISEEFFFKKRSATYKLIDNRFNNISYDNNNFEIKDPNGYLSQDILELSNIKKIENFSFLLKPKTESQLIKNSNLIGLRCNKKNDTLSLLSKFKEKNYIHQKVFSFLMGDDSFTESKAFNGQILFGLYPHDISPYFDEDELYYISLKDKDNLNWHIKFDSVKYKEDDLKDKIAELDINLNVIIGPENFRKKLLNSFFRDFIENNKCKENYFINDKNGQKYIFYSFDNDVLFKEIPNLSFYSKELNETFNLSFSKLFIKYNQRYYFQIIFKKNPDNKWVFGQLFFNTYKFVFDLEEGKIGYYKSYSSKNHPFIVILCIAVFALIFILGYWRGNVMKKNEANLYANNQNQNQMSIRKEYATDSEIKNKKQKDNKEEEKKEIKGKNKEKANDKKIKKE